MTDLIAPVEFSGRIGLACAALLALGAWLAAWLPLAAGLGAPLRRILFALYALRVAAALVVFGVSMALASVPESPVAGPGLWRSVPDAIAYHNWGTDQAEAAARGVRLRQSGVYPLLVGLTYTHVGRNPLPLTLLNGVLDVVTLTLLLVLAGRLWGRAPPTWLAWFLGLWPSWIGWSVQPLKESLLLCLSAVALTLMASLVPCAPAGRNLRRRSFVGWPLLVFILACIGLLRPADAYVFVATLALIAVWILIAALRGHASWQAATVTIAFVIVLPQVRAMAERLIAPSTTLEQARAWSEVGRIYEKEGAAPQARRAYSAALTFSPDDRVVRERLSIVQGRGSSAAGDAPLEITSELIQEPLLATLSTSAQPPSVMERLTRSIKLLNLQTLADVRTNMTRSTEPGRTRFGEHADVSTVSGLLQFMPLALAHVLFAPFPWALVSADAAQRAVSVVSLLELPWIYAIAVLGSLGAFVCSRTGRIESLMTATYVALGIIVLALMVDRDGLLFRYRLQFMAPLALFLPAAMELASVRAVVRRSRDRGLASTNL